MDLQATRSKKGYSKTKIVKRSLTDFKKHMTKSGSKDTPDVEKPYYGYRKIKIETRRSHQINLMKQKFDTDKLYL